jgi:shikimate dehydrogenase
VHKTPQVKAGLFGHPLGKSLSPAVFGVFARLTGVKISYELREVAPEHLAGAIDGARGEGWDGFNVTLPYKLKVAAMLDLSDPAVKAAGSVNTVRFGRAGLEGLNTDARALIDAMNAAGGGAAGKAAAVFGAGGAAASAGWALGRAGAASVTFCARNRAAAAALAARLSFAFPNTAYTAAPFETPGGQPAILVNATPLGMYAPGRPPCVPGPETLAVDLAYAAGGTDFAAAARAAGARTVDGLELLVRQAALSLKFWSGLPGGDIVKFTDEALGLLRQQIQNGGVQ